MKKHFKFKLSLCLFVLLCSVISNAGEKIKESKQNIYFNPALSASVRIPVGNTEEDWKRYSSAGIRLEFPSTMPNFDCFAILEAAHADGTNDAVSAYILHIAFGLQYHFNTPISCLKILPQLGLTNTMVSAHNSFDAVFKENRISFADVENEYGLRFGIEPRLTYKNFFIGIPITIERTFSSPNKFDLFFITLNTGYSFKL